MSRAGWLRLLVVSGAVLLLELACRSGVIKPLTMIPPSAMVAALVALIGAGKLTADIVKTFGNVALAGALAIVVGFGLGVLIHAMPRVRRALDPLFASYYAVPFFVFYPLLIVLFGLNDLPIVAIGFLFAVVAMVINTLNGLDRIPPVFLKVGRTYRLGPLRTALFIKLPATAPHLFTGVKLAVAYAFIGVIAAEFILSGAGIGYSIAYAYNNFDNRTMYALMLLILAVITAVNLVLHVWEQRLYRRRGGR
jgi:NitT/TauT family transport system permease protein